MSCDAFYKLRIEHTSEATLTRWMKLVNQEDLVEFRRFCQSAGKDPEDIEALLRFKRFRKPQEIAGKFCVDVEFEENVCSPGTLLAGRGGFLEAILEKFPGLTVSGTYREGENTEGEIKGWEKLRKPTGNIKADNSAWMTDNNPRLYRAFVERELKKADNEDTTELDPLADQFLAETKRRLEQIQK